MGFGRRFSQRQVHVYMIRAYSIEGDKKALVRRGPGRQQRGILLLLKMR